MQREYVQDLSKLVGQEVTLRGWLYGKRSSGKIQFLILRDGTGLCQCVVMKNAVDAATYAACDALVQESAFAVTGKVQEAKGKAPGDVELFVSKVEQLSPAGEYPITPKEHGVEYLMEHRHLWLRSSRPWATMKVRDTLIRSIRDFFGQRDFVCFDSPILTPNAAEGTSTLFETKYFEEGMAYLSQSGQLYGEAGAMAFGKVYVFGPTFRAERSKTKRHLNEFWMVEPEVAFMDLEGDMLLAEEFVHSIVGRVLEERQSELAILDDGTGRLVERCQRVMKPFERMHYDEAAKILDKYWDEKLASGDPLPPTFKRFEYGDDFGAYDEVALTSLYDAPVIVHHYPAAVKAFYMKRDPNEPDKALAMDVLFPEFGEIIGGSQREDDVNLLLERIEEHKLPQAAFEWYLDLRRYGSVPHAGFGLGLERLVMWICDLDHIREAIPFPRTLTRIWP
ncbi:MAG: asparagine--tRNA ligase [Bacteroidota bacterium]|nr:asparagine--tRNA ligase [Bacteroidota bacterium]MDP4233782.1 asparagine--tRNA ligase [Bacteroidota bacterium]MDP4242421.1 asparagine--tRNA ligase [Bacteroidota bacterium]MDP4287543.1 asparagine--tRNA ligase [Bacteroidota bacterium]